MDCKILGRRQFSHVTILQDYPVLIVRKFNPHIFFGVPLTTKIKQNPYYLPIRFKDREQCVMLSNCGCGMASASRIKWGNCPTTNLRR